LRSRPCRGQDGAYRTKVQTSFRRMSALGRANWKRACKRYFARHGAHLDQALGDEEWNQENSPRAFEHRNGISLNTAGRWLRGLDRLRYLSGRSRAATRVFCSHRFTAEPVGRGAREAGKRRKFERGLINNFALLLRQLLRLSVERASVSAFLSQHVAGYVLKSLSCWATRATSRCSLNTLLLRLLRFE
jgi:hypothetical protein